MKALGVFLAMVAVDFAWARYTQSITDDNPAKAAVWSGVIVALGAYATIAYVGDPYLVAPAILGAGVGTYAAVWGR